MQTNAQPPEAGPAIDQPAIDRSATDPPPPAPDPSGRGSRLGSLGSRYALVGVWVAMAVVYLAIMPDKFARTTSIQAIFGSQQLLVFLAMAALSTLVVGEFDLSVASVMGIAATIIAALNGRHGVDIWLACLVAVLAATACGAVNAFFVVVLRVPSLVVTLGTGTLAIGIAKLLAGSGAVSIIPDDAFRDLTQYGVLGMPVSFWYGLVLVAAFAYVCSCTPLGRHLMFVGASREVARLAGIRVNRIRAGSYLTAGFLAGLAGVVLVSSVGGFNPTDAATYLLPTLAAVFLSTAVVQPGQFNAIGTIISIYVLETGIFGLQLLGLSGWIQDVFYGGGLVFAVALATLVRRHSTTA
ncbi:ABC transporter permease [Actinoallomurus iriomotensis]|uniref:Sugar ABC transporter permease n=1 Tax=Actinoallomurus iriomotensis TaxID=478107 RepID=A0A9W6SDY2_9ACTN|nr:ABC transporter permease [Actinoallomurus iriomotensis]GLY91831.1 sugar ABC transporter permease [Actinoallomurus iriomotensis]